MEDEGEDGWWCQEVEERKAVDGGVVGGLVLDSNEVESGSGCADEEELHGHEVRGEEPAERRRGEKVQVASNKDDEVQELGLEAEPTRRAARVDGIEKQHNAGQVRQVGEDTEQVHGGRGGGCGAEGAERSGWIGTATATAEGAEGGGSWARCWT